MQRSENADRNSKPHLLSNFLSFVLPVRTRWRAWEGFCSCLWVLPPLWVIWGDVDPGCHHHQEPSYQNDLHIQQWRSWCSGKRKCFLPMVLNWVLYFPWNLEHCVCIAFTYSGVSSVANQSDFHSFFFFPGLQEQIGSKRKSDAVQKPQNR